MDVREVNRYLELTERRLFILHEPAGYCGQDRGERQYRLPDAARVSGEDGLVRSCVYGSGDISRGCD